MGRIKVSELSEWRKVPFCRQNSASLSRHTPTLQRESRVSPKPDSYSFRVTEYGASCYLCKSWIRPGSSAYGSAPGVHNRRKRWRWICGRACAEEHGISLEPTDEWARKQRQYEVNIEAVRAAQRHMGGGPDE
jgi:hypothetical protein